MDEITEALSEMSLVEFLQVVLASDATDSDPATVTVQTASGSTYKISMVVDQLSFGGKVS